MQPAKEYGFGRGLCDAIFPPLMFKDLKMSLRKKRAAILELLFLGACFAAAWLLWPKEPCLA